MSKSNKGSTNAAGRGKQGAKGAGKGSPEGTQVPQKPTAPMAEPQLSTQHTHSRPFEAVKSPPPSAVRGNTHATHLGRQISRAPQGVRSHSVLLCFLILILPFDHVHCTPTASGFSRFTSGEPLFSADCAYTQATLSPIQLRNSPPPQYHANGSFGGGSDTPMDHDGSNVESLSLGNPTVAMNNSATKPLPPHRSANHPHAGAL